MRKWMAVWGEVAIVVGEVRVKNWGKSNVALLERSSEVTSWRTIVLKSELHDSSEEAVAAAREAAWAHVRSLEDRKARILKAMANVVSEAV